MGVHDDYGKGLLAEAFGSRYDAIIGSEYTFGPGAGNARLDGTIDGVLAIEIESRTDKQVRGAILDLVLHPYPKKLMVLIPAWIYSAEKTQTMCESILGRFTSEFRVVALKGTGNDPKPDQDIPLIRTAVEELLTRPH